MVTKSIFSEADQSHVDLMAEDMGRLTAVLAQIAKLESRVCREVGMPDQELFNVIVCHPKKSEELRGTVKKNSNRQNLLFLSQLEHPVFDSQGAAYLSGPVEILLENEGFGGAFKALLASNLVKVLWIKKPSQELQTALLFAVDFLGGRTAQPHRPWTLGPLLGPSHLCHV